MNNERKQELALYHFEELKRLIEELNPIKGIRLTIYYDRLEHCPL